MLSGNRNFEARIHPEVKANYLASPPLVVAYALAGRMDVDLVTDPIGQGSDGEDVYLRDLWPSAKEVQETIVSAVQDEMFKRTYADVFTGDERWRALPRARARRPVRVGRVLDLRPAAAVLRRACHPSPGRSRTSPAPAAS